MSTSKGGSGQAIRYRPIFGGAFGKSGRYAMATMPCIERGLHSVRHMVVDPRAGSVLAVASDKREALVSARRLLRAAEELARREPFGSDLGHQTALWPDDVVPVIGEAGARPKPVSRRRRALFDASQGQCHYCGTVLTIDGKWHIEHMVPLAIGGADEIGNLVAACVPCNLAKGDRTALEFITERKAP